MNKITKIINTKKKSFDHSNNVYYQIQLENGSFLLFTASELNKALERYKKWISK